MIKCINVLKRTLPLLLIMSLCSCTSHFDLADVQVKVSDEFTFTVSSDTLTSCSNQLSRKSIRNKQNDLMPDVSIRDVREGWSCDLLELPHDGRTETIFDLADLENSLNYVFKLSNVRDENIALKFISQQVFRFTSIASSGHLSEEWARCENDYSKGLQSLMLPIRNGEESFLYERGLDTCQIVETLIAGKMVENLKTNEYLMTILICDLELENPDFFISNKPYYLLSFSNNGVIQVEISLVNQLSRFGWIDM